MNKIITCLILSMIVGSLIFSGINLVSALEVLKPAKLNQDYTIIQTCGTASWINITISNINGLALTNKQMINNGSAWVYNFTPSTLSRHDVSYISDGCERSGASYFEVTPSGFSGTLGFYFLILIISAGIIILGFSIEDVWLIILGAFGLILVGLFIYLFGIDGIKDMSYTYGLAIITIMVGCYLIVRASMEVLDL